MEKKSALGGGEVKMGQFSALFFKHVTYVYGPIPPEMQRKLFPTKICHPTLLGPQTHRLLTY